MKNTFAVTMTLLLALTLGGSYYGYHLATHKEEVAAAAPKEAAEGTDTVPSATPAKAEGSTGEAPAETAAAAAAANATKPATPAAKPSGNAEAGKTLYTTTCAACHGATGQGGIGLPLNKADGPMSWTAAQFADAVHKGKAPTRELAPTMPRQPQLTDAQLNDLQAFLTTLK